MDRIAVTIKIKAGIETVFDAYVREIDRWWPRAGKHFRYSFAPEGVEPDTIRFEPREGGRLYETFSNGSEYEIGRIRTFDRPTRFAYTWRAPGWGSETLVDIEFAPDGDATEMRLQHSGFAALGDPQISAGYREGSQEIYAIFRGWVESTATG